MSESTIKNEDSKKRFLNSYLIINRLLGYILISPAIFSVIVFYYEVFVSPPESFGYHTTFENLSTEWTGRLDEGGHTSALPFYFGFMAIAGVLLLMLPIRKKD